MKAMEIYQKDDGTDCQENGSQTKDKKTICLCQGKVAKRQKQKADGYRCIFSASLIFALTNHR